MNLVAIRTDVKAALAGIGIEMYDHEPEKAELPAAFPGFPTPISYDSDYDGGVTLEMSILVLVGGTENRYSQLRLAAVVSTEDTMDALEGAVEAGADELWIGPLKPALENYASPAWTSLRVSEATDYGSYEIAGVDGLGVVFNLTIQTN